MEIIKTKNLVRNYSKSNEKNEESEIKVLKGLDFTIKEKEFVGIMGKSGCGKTTLLKVLGMIDQATDGEVLFKEKNVEEVTSEDLAEIRRREIGFIFQDFYLMDSLSVEENIMLPMILDGAKPDAMKEISSKYAIVFDIVHLLQKNPYELSGGEKQRVAICRALVNNPDLILADEPTGNLDSKSGKVVIDTMEKINGELGKTIVMVTHDPQVASHCSRLILLKDGIILEELYKTGSSEEFYRKILEKMDIL